MTDQILDPMEQDSGFYKTLLESTQAIPWKIDWSTMTFAYIGPQIEALLGWSQDSWLTAEDWATRMHPEDQQWVVDFCVNQSQEGIDHEADYRALTADGDYVWIRDVVHVVRNENGEVDCLIGFMFDISERKKNEQELLSLQRQLEEMSFKDGLTGVANRRMFDSVIDTEWHHAVRNQRPLSMIFLDIDYFKQYNDEYGHIQGDECLKRVASILNNAATRSKDFFARYGGEEFVFILPETDEQAAVTVAERCRKLIFKEQLDHRASPLCPVLTISLGVATVTPAKNDPPMNFIKCVDERLYEAKHQGRNRIISGPVEVPNLQLKKQD